jgi:hypothetical protein
MVAVPISGGVLRRPGETAEEQPAADAAPSANDLLAAQEIRIAASKTMRDVISIAMRTSRSRQKLDVGRVNAVLTVLIGMLEKDRAKLGLGEASD